MEHYIGLDVSLKETHICVVDGSGGVVARGREVTQPDLLADVIGKLAPAARLAVLETGGQSSWLQRGLQAQGVEAVIVDARRAKAALSCRLNKTDANDAEGLAQLARQQLVKQWQSAALDPVPSLRSPARFDLQTSACGRTLKIRLYNPAPDSG